MRSILAAAALALVLAPAALADALYHSSHIPLSPVGSSPLRSGFVENIHPNGPNVFAHEQYVLNGAMPNTEYTVEIHISTTPGCIDPFLNFPTATFTTNAAGNGSSTKVFTPADVAGLANSTIYVFWTVATSDGTVVYMTSCQSAMLDS
jgi:hypothetical protein